MWMSCDAVQNIFWHKYIRIDYLVACDDNWLISYKSRLTHNFLAFYLFVEIVRIVTFLSRHWSFGIFLGWRWGKHAHGGYRVRLNPLMRTFVKMRCVVPNNKALIALLKFFCDIVRNRHKLSFILNIMVNLLMFLGTCFLARCLASSHSWQEVEI